MNGFHSRIRTPRRAITLLELLIVMVILLMVTAAAIPIVAPATRNRQMREATRLASAYFGAARARAVQTGRPAGVLIERFNGNPFALQMSQVEVPPPYSGDIVGAVMLVQITNLGGNNAGEQPLTPESLVAFNNQHNENGHTTSAIWFAAQVDPNFVNTQLLRVGDQIQFGNQGHLFTIYGPDVNPQDGVIDTPGGPFALDIAYQYPAVVPYQPANRTSTPFIAGLRFPWENAAPAPQPTSFQVFRQPVRTSTPPLILPDGIVVDLSVSSAGMFFNRQSYANAMGNPLPIGTPAPAPIVTADPMIIFSPTGRLEWVSSNNGQLVRPNDSVYLLFGRRELMFDVTNRMQAQDIVFQNLSPVQTMAGVQPPPAENFWLTIGYQSGQVSVSEVAPNNQDHQGGTYNNLLELRNSAVAQSRLFARQAQSVGGR